MSRRGSFSTFTSCMCCSYSSNLVVCDDSSNDGFATATNLDPQTPIALGSNNPANYNVTYHTSLSDANGDLNAISPTNSFTNTVNPYRLFIFVWKSRSNAANFTTTSFQLQVVSQPTSDYFGYG